MSRFTGRQVVTMGVASCLTLVLMPATVWAASTSLFRLTDGHGHVAAVTSKGQLLVTDGSGALTVDGTVATTQIAPGKPFASHMQFQSGSQAVVIASLAKGHYLHMTSFTMTLIDGGGAVSHSQAELDVLKNPQAGNCSNLAGSQLVTQYPVVAASDRTLQLTYPTPVTIGSSSDLTCVEELSNYPAGGDSVIDVQGYTT